MVKRGNLYQVMAGGEEKVVAAADMLSAFAVATGGVESDITSGRLMRRGVVWDCEVGKLFSVKAGIAGGGITNTFDVVAVSPSDAMSVACLVHSQLSRKEVDSVEVIELKLNAGFERVETEDLYEVR